MNERIRELAQQAGMVRILEEHAGEYGNGMFENTPYPELKKFAELIVKDFQKLIKDAYLNTASEHRDCLLMLDARVEEHFGVEE